MKCCLVRIAVHIIGSERNEPQSLLIHCQIQQVLAVHFRHGNLCPSESSCPSSAREQARFTHTKLYIHRIPLNKKTFRGSPNGAYILFLCSFGWRKQREKGARHVAKQVWKNFVGLSVSCVCTTTGCRAEVT